ncbi:MAG TPA: hypothetical protein PK906_13350 [Spirochaetota bacterium]|nr:hypothetical protein [Spirochaetota bacterium]
MQKYNSTVFVIFLFIFFCSGITFSKEKGFITIESDNISRYWEDRIAFQRIEIPDEQNKDNSVENLLVIKNNKTYHIVDGYDNEEDVRMKKIVMDAENKYIENNDFWLNKINGKPDYIRIIYRRSDLLKNRNEEFVTSNFGQFYKSVRDRFIKLHVEKFRKLMKNRRESKLTLKRRLLSTRVNPENPNDINQKFFKSVTAKAGDETVYYCEDANGDGITETFMATIDDGFNWGIDSGPNIILIKGNTDKDIETMIGKLVNESENGTVEEEKKLFQEFPKEEDIHIMMEQITPMDNFYE